ncbi:hypothetical protein E2P81_ATG02614 [Venturia nashicola]|uniref:Uncharacterized protein n=1 Tax=Venturia nashicola TaxID=86259 RepID=A0A4Z1P5S7_9PEZI|nr:hypothetical protein E6O75_ATG02678 [Venturia nashicola]TLD36832.1 hypothetical protein E2P81_ATG02614 [Venturia nashicola]
MFPRPSSSAYVCLRCHLRLVRRNLHPLSTALPQSTRYSGSSSRSLHGSPRSQFTITRELVGGDGADLRRPQRPEPYDGSQGGHSALHRGGQLEFRNGRVKDKAKLRGKKGGHQVREDAEPLSVNTLGKPAEVIVLRDTPPSAEQEAAKQKEAGEEHAVTDSCRKTLLAALEEEDVPIEQDTVNRQLDALWSRTRPPNSERLIIAEKDFAQLCSVITKRYSIEHLVNYIIRSTSRMSEQSSPQSQDTTANDIANKSPDLHFRPWTPKPTNKSKTRLQAYYRARAVLQKCWGVEIAEEVERLGELVCTLPRSGIELLNAGKPSFLDEITENRQAKLEIDGLSIRITADKASAIYALEDINRLWLQRAVRLFPLSGFRQPKLFRPEDVALVSSITRTTMRYANSRDRNNVAITGIGNGSVEDAFRALLALIDVQVPLESNTSKRATSFTVPGTTDAVMQEVSDLEALPYRDRSGFYGRLCAPITPTQPEHSRSDVESPHISDSLPPQASSSTIEHGPIVEYIATARHWLQPIVSNSVALFTGEPPAWAKFWNPQSIATFSVSIGSVLHPIDSGSGLGLSVTPAAKPSHHARFLRRVPGISSLLPHLSWDRKDMTNILSFRLIHDPWWSSGPPLPDIRLDFEIKPETKDSGAHSKSCNFKGLQLIGQDLRTFVMLPCRAVDLCFKKQLTYHASNEYLETQPEVKKFIERTKANIVADNGTLRAPPSVRIHIPSSFTRHGKEAAPTRSREKSDAGELPETVNDAAILANYYFVGVEHIQSAGYTFGGYPVRHTSVDGGRLGGKYGDLEIFTPKLEEQSNEDDEAKQSEAFVRTVLKMVSLLDTAAQGRLERPGKPGRRTSEDERGDQKSSQPTTRYEEEVNGTQEYADELSESTGDHATIATEPEKPGLAQVNPIDAGAKAPPLAHLDGMSQPIEVTPDECPLDEDQSTITKRVDAEESETPEPEQRAAASE